MIAPVHPRQPPHRTARRAAGFPGWLAPVWMLCLFLLPASGGAAQAGTPVNMIFHWQHQAQFAGYYMALAKGCYAQEGLDVQLLRGGPDVRVGEMLRSGKAVFATFMLSSALAERAQGLPLVHLAQVVNRSNFQLVAWRNPASGAPVRELSDLDGREVTVWRDDFRAPYLALFASKGVRPVILPQYYTLSLFLKKGAVACAAMRYNEYHTLLQNGIQESDVRVFNLHELGIRMPEDGLYALQETWQQHPETCRGFVRASLRGWDYARDHVEETLDVVMTYVRRENLPVNRAHMAWMLREMLTSIFPAKGDAWTFGQLGRGDYDETGALLTRYGGLKSAPEFSSFVTGEGVHVRRP
ncbi:MAG: ABC transporter substrate-binding protein [bacterium]